MLQFRNSEYISQKNGSQDNSVAIATSCGLDGRISITNNGKRFFSAPQRLD
jgi:hypothetical protein